MTDTLILPVAGKDYAIPSPPARVGLALQASYAIGMARRAKQDPPPYAVERAARYDDMTHSLDEDALGPAWQAMIDDDVPLSDLRRAARAAYVWIVSGSEATAHAINGQAEADAEVEGDDPKAGSTATGAASTTLKPGSTSGTTSRRKKSASSKGGR